MSDIPADFDAGEMTKPRPCTHCDLDDKCHGVQRARA
jgi:hypothetical protein